MAAEIRPYPVVDALIEMLFAWLVHAREVAEICNLDSAELAHIAHDLGVARDDLEALVRQGAPADDALPRMLTALGIGRDALDRAPRSVVRNLDYVCSMCSGKRRCDRNLAAGTAALSYRAYCPNAPAFDVLRYGIH